MTDLDRVGGCVDQFADDRRQQASGLHGRLDVGAPFDRALQDERRPALQAHQVGVGDHADPRARAVHDREVVEAFGEHAGQHLARHRVPGDRPGGCRHHLPDRRAQVAPGGEDPGPKVAVGEDAEPVRAGHQQTGHAFVRHPPGRVADAGRTFARHRFPADERPNRPPPEIGSRFAAPFAGQPRPDPTRHIGHPARCAQDAFGQVAGDEIAERVLVGPEPRRGLASRHHGEEAERFALTPKVEQPAVPVQHLNLPGPDPVKVFRRFAGGLEDDGPRREELDLHCAGDALERRPVERVERCMPRQEPPDVHGS